MAREKPVLRVAQRNDAEPSLAHQRGVGEELIRLQLGQRHRLGDGLADFNLHLRIPGVAVVDRYDGRGSYCAPLIPGVINDQVVVRLHGAQVLDGDGIGDSIPDRRVVAL